MEKSMSKRKRTDNAWGYFFIAPSVILILILNIFPVIQTFVFSLQKIDGFLPPVWNGLSNYRVLFSKPEFTKALLNTFIYTLVTVPVGVMLSLLAAVLMNTGIRMKGLFRFCYFLPVISAPAAISMVWRWMYNSDYGIINSFLTAIGIKGPNWIGSSKYVLGSVMVVGIWSTVGYNMVLLLAGLQQIPSIYYEAAEIDGASRFDRFWKITVPLVSPTMFFVVVMTIISSLQVFDNIYMMVPSTSPSIKSAQSIVYLFYKYTFAQQNKGRGSAVAMVLLGIVLIITAVQMKAQKKWVNY